MKFLELALQRVRNHQDALWEEEKHYTWWIYAILGMIIFIYANQSLCIEQKMISIALLSLFGIFISIMGCFVVRREGEFFHEATQIYNRIYNRTAITFGLDQKEDKKRKFGIRDCFQLTFVVSTVIFILIFIFSVKARIDQ